MVPHVAKHAVWVVLAFLGKKLVHLRVRLAQVCRGVMVPVREVKGSPESECNRGKATVVLLQLGVAGLGAAQAIVEDKGE
jgi:hypothetical protein